MKYISDTSFSMAILVTAVVVSQAAGAGQITRFSNMGSIANTRHNMTQSTMFPNMANIMDAWRNQYGEVCVYCHTPHAANNTIAAPLWNRTIKVTNYKTYDELGTTSLTQAVTDTPGAASLTCLSCHDGQTAIDSIINMPGSGMGKLSQQTTQSTTFLNAWNNKPGHSDTANHQGLNSNNGVLSNGSGPPGAPSKGCLACHNPDYGSGQVPDFRLFNIGTDLRDDHPVGVTFPVNNGAGTDWNTPAGVKGASNFFDDGLSPGDNRMQKDEIRTYDGKVECASCHDPHGVPNPLDGNKFNKTFLRKQNTDGSAVCLTCHNK